MRKRRAPWTSAIGLWSVVALVAAAGTTHADEAPGGVESIPVPATRAAAEPEQPEPRRLPDWWGFQIALFTPVQMLPPETPIRGPRFDLPYGRQDDMRGLDLGAVNHATSVLRGVQLGVVNAVDGSAGGAQLGFTNWTGEEFVGLQVGFAQPNDGDVSGVQMGFANLSERHRGLQIGFLNRAGSLKGVQIGVVNLNAEGPLVIFPGINVGW